MEKHFQPRGTAWSLSIIWGSQVKIQRIFERFQIARGKSPSKSLGALDMDSRNESCMIKRTSSGNMATRQYRQWQLPTLWERGHGQKILHMCCTPKFSLSYFSRHCKKNLQVAQDCSRVGQSSYLLRQSTPNKGFGLHQDLWIQMT